MAAEQATLDAIRDMGYAIYEIEGSADGMLWYRLAGLGNETYVREDDVATFTAVQDAETVPPEAV